MTDNAKAVLAAAMYFAACQSRLASGEADATEAEADDAWEALYDAVVALDGEG